MPRSAAHIWCTWADVFALEAQTLSRQTALNSDFTSSLRDRHCLSPETNLLTFPLQMSCPAHGHFCKGSWRAWLCVSLLCPVLLRCFLRMHWFIPYCQVRFTILTVPGFPLDLVIHENVFFVKYPQRGTLPWLFHRVRGEGSVGEGKT